MLFKVLNLATGCVQRKLFVASTQEDVRYNEIRHNEFILYTRMPTHTTRTAAASECVILTDVLATC